MKKRLNVENISSELRGGSAFFPGYAGKPPAGLHPAVDQPVPAPVARPGGEPVDRRTDRPAGRRIPVRRGFEFYEDQLVTLKKLSLQEQLEGKPGSMSAMVREALDEYLKKRTSNNS